MNAVELSPALLHRAFPFHFACDRELRVTQVGPSLNRVAPQVAPGAEFSRVLALRRPTVAATADALAAVPESDIVLLDVKDSPIMLRGGFVSLDDGRLLFLGSPWLEDLGQLESAGLRVRDFAAHDASIDLLHVLQAQSSGLAELRGLHERLARQQARLRRRDARLVAVVEHMLEGLLIVDEQTNALSYANPAAEAILGIPPGDGPGVPAQLVLPDVLAEPVATQPVELGRVREVDARRLDGRRIPIEVQFFEFIANEKPFLAVAIRDVDERRAFERMQRDFMSIVSHELRTPVATLQAAVGLLDDTAIDQRMVPHVKTVLVRGIERLVALIDKVVDLEDLRPDGIPQWHPVQVRPEAVASLAAVRAQASMRRVRLVLEGDDVTVVAEARPLRRIMVELLANAIRVSPLGGTVTLRLVPMTEGARIEVRDEGPGVADDDRESIFLPFRRRRADHGASYSGVGLGLAVCRQLASRLGGTIAVESTDGPGATFVLTLPLVPDPRRLPPTLLEGPA